jgi:hypothetical protein
MPTILKPPRDQWASPEVTDTSHLCSDPTSATNEGEVTNDATASFLSSFMSEFRTISSECSR